ncbi:MAG: hypothetical protein QM296_07840 [Bacillota bacterium]|nr:hypothetical protein [Bacillota bacterium]
MMATESRHPERRRRGSLSLEAAIALPPVLFVLLLLILVIQAQGAERLLRAAAEQTADEYECLLVASELLEPLDIAKGLGIGRVQAFLVQQFFANMDEELGDQIAGDAVARLSAHNLLQRTQELASRSVLRPGTAAHLIRDLSLDMNLDREAAEIELIYHYRLAFPFFDVERCMRVPVALWQREVPFSFSGGSPQAGEEEKKGDSIWSRSNFERGRYFQENYGANLPSTYPGISGYNSDSIFSIRSLDLTAPSYRSGAALDRELYREITRLRDFDGEQLVRDGFFSGVSELPTQRLLSFVIPENSPADAIAALEAAAATAAADGIKVVIHRDGESHHYEKAADDP